MASFSSSSIPISSTSGQARSNPQTGSPPPTPSLVISAGFIRQLGELLRQSSKITEEMIQFFYFSIGYDKTKHIISAEVARVHGNLQSVLQDTLCLSGIPRQSAAAASVNLLDEAAKQLTNAENSRFLENKRREQINLPTEEYDSLEELLQLC